MSGVGAALVLGVLSLLLANPAPRALARWSGLRRTPGAAMLLWQSIALAAVLSALGAGVALASWRVWDEGSPAEPQLTDLLIAVPAAGVTAVVVARLLLSGHRTGMALRRLRRAHRERVDLVANRRGGVSVLDVEVPVAYCVPGMHGSRIVVSHAAMTALGPDEIEAVLAHERSHLRARHDLVLEAFTVLHRAFPRWVASGRARTEVEVLVEVLADRSAVRQVDRRSLLTALLALSAARTPAGALGSAGSIAARAEVLRDTGRHRIQATLVSALAAGVLGAPTLLVVVPWTAGLL